MKETPARTHSLRSTFVRTMLLVAGGISLSTLLIVVVMNVQSSALHLARVQSHIQDGITSKGRVLTHNHALALRSLVLDNAFVDMQHLVERGVTEDHDVVYGLFVNSDLTTLAYTDRAAQPPARDVAPEREAWRKLGLAPKDALLKKQLAQRVSRAGRDVLEVAMPVTAEDGELLGTIRYGLSTERMHQALRSAAADSRARLWKSLGWMGALVSFMTLLALALSRIQAARITRPLAELTNLANRLAQGNRDVRVQIDSGDELELLGRSFNRMVGDLDVSYRDLEHMNRTLEQRVSERTAELGEKNRDMRLVLDNVDQGLISLSKDGNLKGGQSRIVKSWFGEAPEDCLFWDYVGKHSRSFAMQFQLGWEQLCEGMMPRDLCLDQLPVRLAFEGRTWNFRYLPVGGEEQLEGVLIVVDEITERLMRERQEAEQQELMQGFQRVLLDRSGFLSFLCEASEMVNAICGRSLESSPLNLKRILHTLKGNAATLGLVVVAKLCHTLEDQLVEEGKLSADTLDELAARWGAISEHVEKFAGVGSRRMIEISEADYASLVSQLSRAETQPGLLHQVLTWKLEPLNKPFERLAEQARSLARRLGKSEPLVHSEPGSVRLDWAVWSPLFSVLTHVIRNAVDHGFEEPETRAALGKPGRGTLLLKAQTSPSALSFEISDDGRGIDWAAIAEKARERDLPCTTPAELLAALCHDGVTTKTQATDVSGRGVGMTAVKQRVEAMSGQLEVRSVLGVGTTWILSFPPLASERGRYSLRPTSAHDSQSA
jgi:two-component system, chemotaxis family, sensor kinase CheA